MLLLVLCKCALSFAENLSLDMPDVIWQDFLDYGHTLYLQLSLVHIMALIHYAKTIR